MTELFIKNIISEELFGNKICESNNDYQIVSFIYKEMLCERLLYGEPVSIPELRKLLRNKIINFEFIKLDGEVRPAKGTTSMKYVPKKDHPKGIRPSSPKVATFYDLDKDAWRSVSKKNKEVVLKKDEEKGKPVLVVKDKEKSKEKEEPKFKVPKIPIEEPKTKEPKKEKTKVKKVEKPTIEKPKVTKVEQPVKIEEPEETTILIPIELPPEGEVEAKKEPIKMVDEEPPKIGNEEESEFEEI